MRAAFRGWEGGSFVVQWGDWVLCVLKENSRIDDSTKSMIQLRESMRPRIQSGEFTFTAHILWFG
jgi:hypothetical protein